MRVSPEKLVELSKRETTAFTDTIDGIIVKQAREIFGDSARNPERQHLVIRCKETGAEVRLPLPTGLKYDDGDYIVENRASYFRSIANPNSKFAAFLKRYGSAPRVGLDIDLYLNENGWWEIAL